MVEEKLLSECVGKPLVGWSLSKDRCRVLLVFGDLGGPADPSTYAHLAVDATAQIAEAPLKMFTFGDEQIVASGLLTGGQMADRVRQRRMLLGDIAELPAHEARQLYEKLAERFASETRAG